MKYAVVSILFTLTLLAMHQKAPYKACLDSAGRTHRMNELEVRKAEEFHLFYTKRFEQLRSIHPHHNKDVMEAELKMKISGLDLEIARLALDVKE